jgi:hypothetical protein
MHQISYYQTFGNWLLCSKILKDLTNLQEICYPQMGKWENFIRGHIINVQKLMLGNVVMTLTILQGNPSINPSPLQASLLLQRRVGSSVALVHLLALALYISGHVTQTSSSCGGRWFWWEMRGSGCCCCEDLEEFWSTRFCRILRNWLSVCWNYGVLFAFWWYFFCVAVFVLFIGKGSES